MAGGMRFEVPADLAEELIAEGTSVRSYLTRSPGLSDVVELVLGVVNTGADAITVATAAAHMPSFVRRVREYLRRKTDGHSEGSFEVIVREGDQKISIKVPGELSDDEAGQMLLTRVVEVRVDVTR
jgi:hypothetical protein